MCTPLTSDWFLAAVAESTPRGVVVNFTVGFPLVLKVVPPWKRNSTNLTTIKIIVMMFNAQMNDWSLLHVKSSDQKMEKKPHNNIISLSISHGDHNFEHGIGKGGKQIQFHFAFWVCIQYYTKLHQCQKISILENPNYFCTPCKRSTLGATGRWWRWWSPPWWPCHSDDNAEQISRSSTLGRRPCHLSGGTPPSQSACHTVCRRSARDAMYDPGPSSHAKGRGGEGREGGGEREREEISNASFASNLEFNYKSNAVFFIKFLWYTTSELVCANRNR